ncbi:MAG: SGNH/GDSL hydrolase family protein [Desulfomonilaceae bacterium]|jgi:lysophospholipase L1-like esterase
MKNRKQSILNIFLTNLFVLGILVVVLAVIGELTLRHYIPSWDHSGLVELTSTPIVYEMKPNLQIVREGVEIKTNSDGFRDTNFSGEPKPGEFLIAVLGDSFVFGQGVPQSETMSVILQNLLNQSGKTQRFRVWNLGVSGYNTEQEAYLLKSFVLPRKPNWVVVGYNINDCEPIGVDPNSVEKEQHSHEPLIDRLQNYFLDDLLITQFVKQRAGNLIRLFDPTWYASNYVQDTLNQYISSNGGWAKISSLLKQMKLECDSEKIGFTLAILPAMLNFDNYPYKPANDLILSFCKKNSIDCVDILSSFKGHNLMKYWVSALDAHPNQSAQRIFANALADHLIRQFHYHDRNVPDGG